MTDFRQYDQAIADYSSSFKNGKMPLSCWDFYTLHFNEISDKLNDLNTLKNFALEHKWRFESDVFSELESGTVIVVTNPEIQIVYSTRNMIAMNGYFPEEVIGKSLKMFQGEGTSKTITAKISKAVSEKKPFEHTILNYHKDGTSYDCHIKGFPVFNNDGELAHFIAFEKVA